MELTKTPMTSRMTDMSGARVGKLTVIEYAGTDKWKEADWRCKCDCGNETFVSTRRLKHEQTKSCGCLISESASARFKTHGLSTSRIYRVWHEMRGRCYNKNDPNYYLYGGRGITVCDEWNERGPNRENIGFMNFNRWANANGYDDTLTIDRINPDANYCPENCRWVDDKMQANNRRNNRYIELELGFKKFVYTLSEWSQISKVPYATISTRLLIGWKPFDAIFTPVNEKPGEYTIIPVITPEMEARNHLNYLEYAITNTNDEPEQNSDNPDICRIHILFNKKER